MSATAQHVEQIPQAANIAASPDPSIPSDLRQQAVEYLNKVRELCEETWQACLTLYLQGAGSGPTSPLGKDGKPKQSNELRIFCLQVVDEVLINKPQFISEPELLALHQALVAYVQTEFVEGSAESGFAFIRNRFSYTITLVFLRLYPEPVEDFLTPFLAFLNIPQSSSQANNLSAALLTLHTLCEIAAEIHDPLLRSSRKWTEERQNRDMLIRDNLRKRGHAKIVIEGLLQLVERGLENENDQMLQEAAEWALKALATWAPWVEITDTITPTSLSLYQRFVQSPNLRYCTGALSIYRALLAKGARTSAESLQIMQILDVMSFLGTLEEKSRISRNAYDRTGEEEQFREILAKVLCQQGLKALDIADDESGDQSTRAEGEKIYYATLPLAIRFLSDPHDEVSVCVDPLIDRVLGGYKKLKKLAGKDLQLSSDKTQFLVTLLEALVQKLQWPAESEWYLDINEEDADAEEMQSFLDMRTRLRGNIDSIATIDQDLFNTNLVRFIIDTLKTYQSQGSSALSWQQAELAVYLIYIYGETQKSGLGKDSFFIIPQEVVDLLKGRAKQKADHYRALRKGETTNGVSEAPQFVPIDYKSFPLTLQGQLLVTMMDSQILSYPHSAISVQCLEACVRYVEFFKCRRDYIQPALEAFVDIRGIHNPRMAVRHRILYLFAKFVRDVRSYIDAVLVVGILNSIGDALPIHAEVPEMEQPGMDPLLVATTGPQPFDYQLHVFEAVGSLISLGKNEEQQISLIGTVLDPLVSGIDKTLNQLSQSSQQDTQGILQCHHLIMAIGALAKGFPESPDPLPVEPPIWLRKFQQAVESILKALSTLKGYKIIRDASRSAFSGIIAAMNIRVIQYIPLLVGQMLQEFEAPELVEFLNFLGMLTFKLRSAPGDSSVTMPSIMDELFPLLSDRVFNLLGQPATGTDDDLMQEDLKKGYLAFLSTILAGNLQSILCSDRNRPNLESFVNGLTTLATTGNDRLSQKSALGIIVKTLTLWATNPDVGLSTIFLNEAALTNGQNASKKSKDGMNGAHTNGSTTPTGNQLIPGYEMVIYSRVIPAVFELILSPAFRLKDGQSGVYIYEIASFLREIITARGQEGIEFIKQFLVSKGCPADTADNIIMRMRGQQIKDFRNDFREFIKLWKGEVKGTEL